MEAFNLYETLKHKSGVENGNSLMLTRLTPVSTLVSH